MYSSYWHSNLYVEFQRVETSHENLTPHILRDSLNFTRFFITCGYFNRISIGDMSSICAVISGCRPLELFGGIVVNNCYGSIRFCKILHMHLKQIKFFTHFMCIYGFLIITFTIGNFKMTGLILILAFQWVGRRFRNYKRSIKMNIIKVRLTLNKLVISIGVKIFEKRV